MRPKRLAALAFAPAFFGAALPASASAQSPLSTAALVGQGDTLVIPGQGVYFDLSTSSGPVVIRHIAVAPLAAEPNTTISLFTCLGSHRTIHPTTGLAPMDDPRVWRDRGTYSASSPSAGGGALVTIDIRDFPVGQGTTGVFIRYDNTKAGMQTGILPGATPPPFGVSTQELTLTTGTSSPPRSGDTTPGHGGNGIRMLFAGEIGYSVPVGVTPDFVQDIHAGNSLLPVTFTDTTVTDSPNGLLHVQFDFESDGIFDATIAPGGSVTHSFACGIFDVTMLALDSLHGPATTTLTQGVTVDALELQITSSTARIGPGQLVYFSAMATPGATLRWDFQGDLVVDSTLPDPWFLYPDAGVFTATCTATLGCNSVQATRTIEVQHGLAMTPDPVAAVAYDSPPDAAYVDLQVTHPIGVQLQQIIHRSATPNTRTELELWMLRPQYPTTNGHVVISKYTLAARGSAVSPSTPGEPFAVDIPPTFLPPGFHGIAIVSRAGGHLADDPPVVNAQRATDLTIIRHAFTTNFGPGPLMVAQVWTGGFRFQPVDDLRPGFTSAVTAGNAPLTVQFSDRSATNDPAGITAWAWDFESDGVVDATSPDPLTVYSGCGDRTVSLTVSDAVNGSRTLTRPDYIAVDPLEASLHPAALDTSVGQSVTYQYTGTQPATVTWDLDGDGTPDATGNLATINPGRVGSYTVRMTAARSCRQQTVEGTLHVLPPGLQAPGLVVPLAGPTAPASATWMDVQVTDPQGITVTHLGVRSPLAFQPLLVEVWAVLGEPIQGDFSATRCQPLASGVVIPEIAHELTTVSVSDFYLPPGVHGLAVVHRSVDGTVAGQTLRTGNVGFTSSDASLAITPRGTDLDFDSQGSGLIDNYLDGFSGAIYHVAGLTPAGDGSLLRSAQGCPGSSGQAEVIAGTATPRPGATWSAEVTHVPAFAQLHGGVSNTFHPQLGLPLPQPLGPLLGTAPACVFQQSSDVILTAASGVMGRATFSLPVPGNSALAGLQVHLQAVVFDPSAPGSLVLSHAYSARIQ